VPEPAYSPEAVSAILDEHKKQEEKSADWTYHDRPEGEEKVEQLDNALMDLRSQLEEKNAEMAEKIGASLEEAGQQAEQQAAQQAEQHAQEIAEMKAMIEELENKRNEIAAHNDEFGTSVEMNPGDELEGGFVDEVAKEMGLERAGGYFTADEGDLVQDVRGFLFFNALPVEQMIRAKKTKKRMSREIDNLSRYGKF